MSQKIAVLGLGFVGLTTALGFAEKGQAVVGFDADPTRRQAIAEGQLPFHEPGLDVALANHLGHRFLVADTMQDAVAGAHIIFLCVGTPCREDGAADLSILLSAIRQAVQAFDEQDYRLLVVKSTVPPGTTAETVQDFLRQLPRSPDDSFGVASNPEFLREGYAWDDFIHPDRIILGVNSEQDWQMLAGIYEPFAAPIHRVSPTEAEFIKYLSNTLLATMISFSNEMAMLADRIGDVDIPRTFGILHQDKRWSGNPASMASYVYPGCGYGGYCLPKDTQAMAYLARSKGLLPEILDGVIHTNHKIKVAAADRITSVTSPQTTIGILGLSFKPNSDDVRDSPAKDLISHLLARGYKKILAHDPIAAENFSAIYSLPVGYRDSLMELIAEADLLVIATAWDDYRKLRSLAPGKPIIDLRYCLA